MKPLWHDDSDEDGSPEKCVSVLELGAGSDQMGKATTSHCTRSRSTPDLEACRSSPEMEVSITNTEVKPEFQKETPSKDLDAPDSVQDTEPTMAGTPRGNELTIEIPQDDEDSSGPGLTI